jgi:hypothetical protein
LEEEEEEEKGEASNLAVSLAAPKPALLPAAPVYLCMAPRQQVTKQIP